MLTCERNFLFQIETNLPVLWEDLAHASKLEKDDVAHAASQYGFSAVSKFSLAHKRNLLSKIYRVTAGTSEVILRTVPTNMSHALEAQCESIHSLKDAGMIAPLKTKANHFVFEHGDFAWIAYPFKEGEIFNGDPRMLSAIFESCFSLLSKLCSQPMIGKLPQANHEPAEWGEMMVRFTDPARLEDAPLSDLLTPGTRRMILENREELCELAKNLSSYSLGEACVTHNDLHHGNILVSNGMVTLLDLEDVCVGSPDIALAHCIFKMLRHAIYSESLNLQEVQDAWLSRIFDDIPEGFQVVDLKSFYQYGQYRTLSDLQKIDSRLRSGNFTVRSTDLEKKFHHLFELEQMTQ